MSSRWYKYWAAAAAALIMTGCTPGNNSTTMTTTPYTVQVCAAYPEEAPLRLILASGAAGMMRLIGDSSRDFVTGTIEVTDRDRVPVVMSSGCTVSLVQKSITSPDNLIEITNLWKLRVSDKAAFSLEIHNPQAEGHWNLSGLPITDLYAELGTVKNAFTFDQTNPVVMQRAEFQANSGPLVIEGILNAACREMVARGGAGELTIRFGGKLSEGCRASVQTGTGPVKITVSPDTPARIIIAGSHAIATGESLIRQDTENDRLVFETAAYKVNHDTALEIEINGTPTQVYLNPPS